MDDTEELDELGYGFEPFEQQGESLLGDPEPAPAPASAESSSDAPAGPASTDDGPRPVAEAPAAPLALYRRYRPDSFADVIGQEHVTEPLMRALTNNRVNHAYLFSGPRGCGKTTSARILARALNCEQGPRPDPCGECRSCRDLARGGPGSIDVIEIDAASHGGVDDARDLRERAFFAPVHSRYKIYIVDEAHMVTTAGFNALLKLVEEPPPHVKFVFATTEPEKVIGTIRSRTHHYPFRLVPPKVLQAYLGKLCDAEGIPVEQTVLPLVVRAGQGSVRDSLSVLDQLLGGASQDGVSYAQAAALLGYTPDSLLDEILDAFAAGDAKGVFQAVDKVIEVGQDPRRFGEDLLRRLRDLVIVAAVPDALSSGLIEAADDQGERLASQAAAMGAGELTRAAEVIATGLTEMRGTTAPRLHLELMCSRVLLPGADVDERGVHARLDRLERRIGMAAMEGAPQAAAEPAPAPRSTPLVEPAERVAVRPESTPDRAPEPAAGEPVPEPRTSEPTHAPEPTRTSEPAGERSQPAPSQPAAGQPAPDAPAQPAAAPQGRPTDRGGAPGLSTADVRRLWPDVLEEVKTRRRFTWVLISQNAQVHDVTDGVLTLALKNAGARDGFSKGGSEDVLRDALVQVLGADLKITTMVDGAAAAPAGRPQPARGPPPPPHPPPRPAQDQQSPAQAQAQTPEPQRPQTAEPRPARDAESPARTAPPTQQPGRPQGDRSARPGQAGPPPDWIEPDPDPEGDPPEDAHLATLRERPHERTTESSGPGETPTPAAAPAPAAPPAPTAGAAASLSAQARQGIRPTRRGPAAPAAEGEPDYDEADFEPVEGADAATTTELLTKHLGAELIGEEDTAT